ncbi:MAG: 2,3-bisphosphoglycerate-independent phosphoglycerate mutase, partial [Candidatus ainarchaeum sp.]|nr:2,3-bisphosphoglycerate-independent phosphoglycerate mutase [Candidatus ainarchaeum sp.]
GKCGVLYPLGEGEIPPSDKSHLVLFGYDLKTFYRGRGPMEALGTGIKLKKGDVAFRANFATVKNGIVVDRRAGRIETPIAKKLGKKISMKIEDVEIIFKNTVEHRGALVLRGRGLGEEVEDVDPKKIAPVPECRVKKNTPENKKTARIINLFIKKVQEILNNENVNNTRELPANIILLRGAGSYNKIESIKQRFGLNSACVAGGALYQGVAKYVGMDIIKVKGATGDKNTDLKAKGKAAVNALKKYDFVFLHVKATDSFSHDKNCNMKREIIEKIDKELIPILIHSKASLIITGDHSTPCESGDHSTDPVPILIFGDGKDEVEIFDEKSCVNGKLGKVYGKDLIEHILNLTRQK